MFELDKHHVARLMNVYTNHKTSIDHESPLPTGKKVTPLTQLYGVNGNYSLHWLLSSFILSLSIDSSSFVINYINKIGIISSKVQEETLKKREKEWQSRLVITENLDQNKRKEFLRNEISLRNSVVESKSKKSTTTEQFDSTKSQSTIPKNSQSSQASMTSFNHRIDDPEMSENDLIANGLYYLNSEQLNQQQQNICENY